MVPVRPGRISTIPFATTVVSLVRRFSHSAVWVAETALYSLRRMLSVSRCLKRFFFDVRLRQLVQPAGNGGETDLQDHQSNNQHDIVPERAVVTPHRAVHNVPQEQGEEDSQASADCLNQRQNQYISFFLPVTRQSHRTALSTAHRFHAKKPPDKGETFTFA